jgi:hypothetical protein
LADHAHVNDALLFAVYTEKRIHFLIVQGSDLA